jgi:hypothetical protein
MLHLMRIARDITHEASRHIQQHLDGNLHLAREIGAVLLRIPVTLFETDKPTVARIVQHVISRVRGTTAVLKNTQSIRDSIATIHNMQYDYKLALSGCMIHSVRESMMARLHCTLPRATSQQHFKYLLIHRSLDRISNVPLPYNTPIIWDHRWRIEARSTTSALDHLPALTVTTSSAPPREPYQRRPPALCYPALPSIIDTRTNKLVYAHLQSPTSLSTNGAYEIDVEFVDQVHDLSVGSRSGN